MVVCGCRYCNYSLEPIPYRRWKRHQKLLTEENAALQNLIQRAGPSRQLSQDHSDEDSGSSSNNEGGEEDEIDDQAALDTPAAEQSGNMDDLDVDVDNIPPSPQYNPFDLDPFRSPVEQSPSPPHSDGTRVDVKTHVPVLTLAEAIQTLAITPEDTNDADPVPLLAIAAADPLPLLTIAVTAESPQEATALPIAMHESIIPLVPIMLRRRARSLSNGMLYDIKNFSEETVQALQTASADILRMFHNQAFMDREDRISALARERDKLLDENEGLRVKIEKLKRDLRDSQPRSSGRSSHRPSSTTPEALPSQPLPPPPLVSYPVIQLNNGLHLLSLPLSINSASKPKDFKGFWTYSEWMNTKTSGSQKPPNSSFLVDANGVKIPEPDRNKIRAEFRNILTFLANHIPFRLSWTNNSKMLQDHLVASLESKYIDLPQCENHWKVGVKERVAHDDPDNKIKHFIEFWDKMAPDVKSICCLIL
ncbi:hypothetical protein AN958_08066 [Leucoagaricus sp. SymC.cos]|nr:hypothetical protein AN958_08066 [Leucoagaricus sp. SymC.cos]